MPSPDAPLSTSTDRRQILNIESLSYLPGLGFVFMRVWGLTFVLFPHAWIGLFTPDLDVLAYSIPLMTAMGVLQPPLAIAMVFSGALRGAGETPVVIGAAEIGGWCLRLPLVYAGGVAIGLGMSVVWATMVMDWVVRGLIVWWRYSRLRLEAVRL
jgi:Na+-driven multidrug efflux pump